MLNMHCTTVRLLRFLKTFDAETILKYAWKYVGSQIFSNTGFISAIKAVLQKIFNASKICKPIKIYNFQLIKYLSTILIYT